MPCNAHCFHEDCIKKWLKNNSVCPSCRTQVTKENLKEQKKVIKESKSRGESFMRRDSSVRGSTIDLERNDDEIKEEEEKLESERRAREGNYRINED